MPAHRIPAALALAFSLAACITGETGSLSSGNHLADARATNAAAPAPAAHPVATASSPDPVGASSPGASVASASPASANPASASPTVASPKAKKEDPPPKKSPLVRAEIGKPAPEFELQDLDGKTVRLASFKGKTVVLEWFSPTCPYCVYAYSEKGPLRHLPERLAADRVVWLSICSEDPANPGGKVETMKEFVKNNEMKAPLLVDAAGTVGRAYGAKSTPHMFVVSEKGVLVYQGALDNAPGGKVKDEGLRVNYVEKALADLRSGHAVTIAETKSYG